MSRIEGSRIGCREVVAAAVAAVLYRENRLRTNCGYELCGDLPELKIRHTRYRIGDFTVTVPGGLAERYVRHLRYLIFPRP